MTTMLTDLLAPSDTTPDWDLAACATYAGETRQSGIWGGKEFRRGRVTRG